jgi:probable phosphoglycerate mutase
LTKSVDLHADLREIEYGDWDGSTPAELDEDPTYRAWLDDPAAHAPPGGETAIAVATRATRAVEELRRRHGDGRILVVSHKTTIRVLLCALLGLDPRLYRVRLAQPLGGLLSVTFTDRGPRLDALADLSHLPPALRGIAGS